MERPGPLEPYFPADAFAGTSAYYVRHRVPYPEALLRDLFGRAGVTGEGALLDLACGPGRLTLRLAPRFRETWGVDLEPEMIERAQEEAARCAAEGIRWRVGRAEDFEAAAGSFELVTFGEAFHRLDQEVLAAKVLRWLKPGCCVASLGSYSIPGEKEAWQRLVMETVRKWTDGGRRRSRAPAGPKPGSGPDNDERVFRAAGFVEVATYPIVEPHAWTVEAILGFLYSTSFCSKKVLGGEAERFEADLTAALLAHDPGGVYREEIRWGYTLGRKPKAAS